MENPIIEAESYQKIAQTAKELYKKVGIVQCSSLNDTVTFNNVGFKHLVRKGGIPRPKSEQKRRFELLQYAKPIIKNPNAKIQYRIAGNTKFWAFTDKTPSGAVTVVVRQIQNRKKHFFSIFKQKSAH
jgi:hypothetical protein